MPCLCVSPLNGFSSPTLRRPHLSSPPGYRICCLLTLVHLQSARFPRRCPETGKNSTASGLSLKSITANAVCSPGHRRRPNPLSYCCIDGYLCRYSPPAQPPSVGRRPWEGAAKCTAVYSLTACRQYTRVYSLILELGSPPCLSSYLFGLGCSSTGGCETDAKSHRCIKERTRHDVNQRHDNIQLQGSVVLFAINKLVVRQNIWRSRPALKLTSLSGRCFVLSLQRRLRRCSRVCLLLLPSSPCFSVSSGYEMLVQCNMEEIHR